VHVKGQSEHDGLYHFGKQKERVGAVERLTKEMAGAVDRGRRVKGDLNCLVKTRGSGLGPKRRRFPKERLQKVRGGQGSTVERGGRERPFRKKGEWLYPENGNRKEKRATGSSQAALPNHGLVDPAKKEVADA